MPSRHTQQALVSSQTVRHHLPQSPAGATIPSLSSTVDSGLALDKAMPGGTPTPSKAAVPGNFSR